MKKSILVLLLLSLCFSIESRAQKRVLVYTKTGGYAHASIPDGIKAVQNLGIDQGFEVDTTSNSLDFTDKNLSRYNVIVCISTNPSRFLDDEQKKAFVRFIQAGNGFVGIHGASAGAQAWPWYAKLVGASFSSHPEPKEGVLLNIQSKEIFTKHIPKDLTWKDEWYNFSNVEKDLNVVLSVDEASFIGGEYGYRKHPISWFQEYDGGRSFYTALGHFSYHFTDAFFVKHISEGLKYAMGDSK